MHVRHTKTGGIYSVVALAVQESDLTPVVVYSDGHGQMWTRPAKEFFDGRFEIYVAPAAAALPGEMVH